MCAQKQTKDTKIMLIVKNVDMELLQKIQKVITEHNQLKMKRRGRER